MFVPALLSNVTDVTISTTTQMKNFMVISIVPSIDNFVSLVLSGTEIIYFILGGVFTAALRGTAASCGGGGGGGNPTASVKPPKGATSAPGCKALIIGSSGKTLL